MRPQRILTHPVALALLQQLVAIWFLWDFFMARDSLTARSLWRDDINDSGSDLNHLSKLVMHKHCQKNYTQEFDKLVLVVIDALGAQFIPSIPNSDLKTIKAQSMPFLEDLIQRHEARGFVAKAATPTVTMPRIKALLSGTIPSFVDIAYNLASDVSKFTDDNLLLSAKSANKTLVFYGDDTWLSLFDRKIFTRSKETFSFFASDFTTVDTNVTDFAIPETSKDHLDWDFLFLHYLGLDHIGHLYGTNENKLIDSKLLEMDSILKSIYNNMSNRREKTLLVVCGDHGMSQEGNHGGGTDFEVDTAMVFIPIGSKLFSNVIEQDAIKQVDFSATVSILTGLPIPSASRGVLIEPLIKSLWSTDSTRITCAIHQNLVQLARLLGKDPKESLYDQLIKDLLSRHLEVDTVPLDITHEYFSLARKVQDILLLTVADKRDPLIIVSILLVVSLASLFALRKTSRQLLLPMSPFIEQIAYLVILIIPILMNGSTDFIEMEHIFWPIFSILSLLVMIVVNVNTKSSKFSKEDMFRIALFIATFVFTSTYNRFKLSRDSTTLSVLSLVILCNYLRQNSSLDHSKLTAAIVIFLMIGLTKFAEEDTSLIVYRTVIQQVASLVAIMYTSINATKTKADSYEDSSQLIQRLSSGWMIWIFLLSRSHNFAFLAANILMEVSLNTIANAMQLSFISRALIYVNFAQSAFYNQGNTNLFSSIDVSPAFFAQTDYNIYLAVPLVAMASHSAQMYWYMKLLQRVQGVRIRSKNDTRKVDYYPKQFMGATCNFINLRNYLSLSYFMFVCLVLRNHLFVWSVLSPKLIYHYVSNIILLTTTSSVYILCNLASLYQSQDTSKERLLA